MGVGRTYDRLLKMGQRLAAGITQCRLPPCATRPFLTVMMSRGRTASVAVDGHEGYAPMVDGCQPDRKPVNLTGARSRRVGRRRRLQRPVEGEVMHRESRQPAHPPRLQEPRVGQQLRFTGAARSRIQREIVRGHVRIQTGQDPVRLHPQIDRLQGV